MNGTMSKKVSSGFTLIELLIVVAIIAILAAIAVPNFLEAQVRAKVSRTKADMRSLATGLDAYRIDHNVYPPDGDDIFGFNVFVDFDVALRLRPVTTPIAYMTSLPIDVFHENRDEFLGSTFLYPGDPPYTYAYLTFGSFTGAPAATPPLPGNQGNPTNYSLLSQGPSRSLNSLLGATIEYDPTNGTVSLGDIVRRGGEYVTQ